MVLDTSVLVHIMTQESGWRNTVDFLNKQESLKLSAGSHVELQAVMLGRLKQGAHNIVNKILQQLNVEVMALTPNQADIARLAYATYGRGQNHPARLNFGDVLSYALAKSLSEQLAYVGDDFGHTDLRTVRLPA